MADQFLGYRYAILLGAVLMAIGEFLIVGGAVGGSSETLMLYGMGALIVGNGFFKANISTIVGKLYEDNDPRRDSGFTIFYIGINIGALLATTVVAFVERRTALNTALASLALACWPVSSSSGVAVRTTPQLLGSTSPRKVIESLVQSC